MRRLARRTEGFRDSGIRRMTRLAIEHGAINLAQGFPETSPPSPILRRLAEVASEGPHQYAISWGAPNFRAAIAARQSHLMGLNLDPERHIVATDGSTEAMMLAALALLEPGESVITFSPSYEAHWADPRLLGAQTIFVPLVPPDFSFSEQALAAAFAAGAKALILCNPANPSGKVFSQAELEMIAAYVEKYDAFVITDEVYEHIVYRPCQHRYFAALPGMFERTFSISSLSKTYHMTGWRLGWIVAPEPLVDAVKNIHDFLVVCPAAPLMEAATVGLELDESYYEELREFYTKRRTLVLNGLRRIGIEHTEPQGAYYVLLDISRYGFASDREFCECLTREGGVATVPGSAFFREDVRHFARLHFAKEPATLNEALNRLEAFVHARRRADR
jgi:aminotransferase